MSVTVKRIATTDREKYFGIQRQDGIIQVFDGAELRELLHQSMRAAVKARIVPRQVLDLASQYGSEGTPADPDPEAA